MTKSETEEYDIGELPRLKDLTTAFERRYDDRYEKTMMASCELYYRRPDGARRATWSLWLIVVGTVWVETEVLSGRAPKRREIQVTALTKWPDDPDMATETMRNHRIRLTYDVLNGQRGCPIFEILD